MSVYSDEKVRSRSLVNLTHQPLNRANRHCARLIRHGHVALLGNELQLPLLLLACQM